MTPEEQLERWVEECSELRYGTAGDPEGKLPEDYGQTIEDLIHTLTRVRQRSDRVEEILTRVRRLRSRLSAHRVDAEFDAEIRRDEAFQMNRATRVAEFVTADERRADAALDSIQEKRAAHAAKRLADQATDAYYLIEGLRKGLSDYRQDVRAILHARQVVSSMEYSGRA